MKTVELSTEDFEYLRFVFRTQVNAMIDDMMDKAKFARAAHKEFPLLGNTTRVDDKTILEIYREASLKMIRIDEALAAAQGVDTTDES